MNKTLFITTICLALLTGVAAASAQAPYSFSPRYFVMRPFMFPTRAAPTTTRATAPRPGSLTCRAEENGAYARSSFAVLRAGQRVASGTCGEAISLAAGTYDVVITLETALDRPTRTVRATVPQGGSFHANASFATAILEVRFTRDGRPAAGMAILRRDGREIGTLASGVAARVSAGRYEVVARYRTMERRYTVDLAPEQRRAIRAAF